MKKTMKMLIALLIVSTIAFIPVVSAATTEPEESVIIDLYKQQQELSEVDTDTETKDNLKQTDMGSYSSLLSAYRKMYGPDLVPDSNPKKQELLQQRPYLRYGIVQYSTTTMINAFYMGPSANIPQQYAQMFLPKQLIEASGTAFAATTPPDGTISSRTYMGYLGLNKIWGVTFSLAMAILVLILIVAGFMIMFRSKAGGQVVVTVSMALQNAVIGAVLALASYAIGAFFLNLSKYLVLMIGALFQAMVFGGDPNQVIYINGPWNLFATFWTTMAWGSFSSDWTNWTGAVKDGFVQNYTEYADNPSWSSYWDALKSAYGSIASVVGFSIVSVIAKLIIGAAMLVVSIRIFWTVMTTYIKMIIDIVVAPILFMFAALPGKQTGFTTWISRMFKNAIAVPFMFALVNLAAYLAFTVSVATETCMTGERSILTCVTGGMIPGGTTGNTDWLLMAVGPSAIISLVVLNMVPTVPVMINEMFSAKGGDFSKAWEGTKKSLQSVPVVGGMFQ